MYPEKEFKRKYVWSSLDFDMWLKKQKQELEKRGFRNIDGCHITHALVYEYLIPQNIRVKPLGITKDRKKRAR